MKQIQTSNEDNNIAEFAIKQNSTIAEFLQQCKNDREQRQRDLMTWHRPITKEHFWMMMQASAGCTMAQRSELGSFECDNNNAEILQQLYLYIIASDKCKLNTNKGIYLQGAVGNGKSLLMSSFCNIIAKLCHKIITQIHAKILAEDIEKNGVDKYIKIPLMIDDLGRENSEINHFGKKIKPIQDLFSQRYEYGSLTFVTSNFTLETLECNRDKNGNITEQRYGNFIKTRMEEMMNVVTLPGQNRRRTNKI